jgi:hypothetical protein
MGYCISVLKADVKILAVNQIWALKAVQSLHGKETQCGKPPRFSWVSDGFHKIDNLKDILREWRWAASYDKKQNIVSLEFTGEKYGDDAVLFDALAPFIEAGGEIHFTGEDGDQWKYLFDGKCRTEKQGKVEVKWD